MKNFNTSRFLSVARWDLVVNRAFYIKTSLAMIGCAALPVIFYYLSHFIDHGIGNGKDACFTDTDFFIPVLISWFTCCMIVGMYGFMFHNLRNRQGRISELTLPASNLERFLWHAMMVVILTQVLMVLSVVVTDVLRMVMSLVVCGGTPSYLLTSKVLSTTYDGIPQALLYDGNTLSIIQYLIGPMLSFAFMSTFALVNAWKYRYNIAYTILFHILLWIGIMFLIAIFVPAFGGILKGVSSLDIDFPGMIYITASLVFILCCVIWWLTYRLYCRAQVTTKRNP